MQTTTHAILSARPSGMTPRRMAIIGGVALLHVAAVYAIVSGMTDRILPYVPPALIVHVDPTSVPKQPPAPPKVLVQKTVTPAADNTIRKPDIDIADTQQPPINVIQSPPSGNPPPPDTSAAGMTNTHTVPPYPAEARAAAHQGTVMLQIVVSAQGDVASASVLQSSGFPELDQAAVTWVRTHWKYKPALQGGSPVPSQTQAAVRFDLKQASR